MCLIDVRLFFLCFVGLFLSSCSSSKQCFSDGVCETIERNGQVSYVGDQDKIASHLKHKQEAEHKHMSRDDAFRLSPRRAQGEPIVLAVVWQGVNSSVSYDSSPELFQMGKQYQDLLVKNLQQFSFLSVLSAKDSRKMEDALHHAVSPNFQTVEALYQKGLKSDIYVFLSLGAEKDLSHMQGIGKVAVPLVKPRFEVQIFSRFENKPLQNVETGGSTAKLERFTEKNKDTGLVQSGVKFNRDALADEPYLNELALKISRQIDKEMREQLPNQATVEKYDGPLVPSTKNPFQLIQDLF